MNGTMKVANGFDRMEMKTRFASINDLAIAKSERKLTWPSGRRPDDYPSLSQMGL